MKKLIFFILITSLFASLSRAQQPGSFTNHGPQLTAAMIQGSIFLKDKQGKLLLYTVVRGEPAHLLAYEVKSGRLLLDIPLPKTDGVWDLAQSTDGTLYIPGAGGKLFSHKIGSKSISDLGNALPNETYLWSLTAGKNGEVFGATYPGCRVFRYHPKDGFSDLIGTALVPGENYVRSLAFDQKRNLLYAGVGSHAHLIEINLSNKNTRELLPTKYHDKEFVYALELVKGKDGADRLLALLTGGQTTLVYHIDKAQVEQEIDEMDMKMVAADAKANTYFTTQNQLKKFDAAKPIGQATKLIDDSGSANAIFKNGNQILIFNAKANLISYDEITKKKSTTKLKIPAQPIPINAIMYGPDGKIWTGGYLAGGHATFDPVSGINTKYLGLDQTEGMAFAGNSIYFGIYPKGRFYSFDVSKPWNLAANNPKLLFEEKDQSRSFAVLPIPDKKMVYFGTVPEYGKLGGVLTSYNLAVNKHQSFGEVLSKQSVASLARKGDILIVGGSVSGGLGKKAESKEAELLLWDLNSNLPLQKLIPVKGAAAITRLINGPDGHIWGIADGNLFILDVAQGKILSLHKLYDYPPLGSHIWRSAYLAIHPSGYIYGSDNGKLFKLDPTTKKVDILAENAGLMVMDPSGKIFFKRGIELWSYQP